MLVRLGAGFVALSASLVLAQGPPELPPVPGDLSTPVQARLAFNGASGMTVGWNTFEALKKPTVHFGLSKKALWLSASSSSSVTYPTSRTWANTVHLTGLLPGTEYYYKIDSTNSTIDSFRTARIAGDHASFTAALVVDMGVFGPDGLSSRNISYTGKAISPSLDPGAHTTIESLVADVDNYEFVLHPGDFAYADAWLKEENLGYINGTVAQGPQIYEGLNEQFFDQLSAVSKIKPYMVVPGNHEANCVNGGSGAFNESICPVGQTNFTGFINRFGLTMPTAPTSSKLPRSPLPNASHKRYRRGLSSASSAAQLALPPFWYSFDYGMTHFVMFDTETDLGVGLTGPDQLGGGQNDVDGPFGSYADQQVDFLHKDLASVDRLKTPWVVAAGHRPWYVSNGFPCAPCQTAFEPILNEYGVDLAVFGHTHNSQLILPTAYNVTDPAKWNNPKAPAYIVAGGAGHFEGLEPLLPVAPSYLQYGNDTVYGYTKMTFRDRNHLTLQLINSQVGSVLTEQTLFKEHTKRYYP